MSGTSALDGSFEQNAHIASGGCADAMESIESRNPSRHLPKLTILGYPYVPRPDTGRGIDRYLHYLAQEYDARNVPYETVENGPFSNNIEQLLMGEPSILAKLFRKRSRLWHAVSPVGGRALAITGRTPFVTTIHDVMPFYLWSANPVRYTFLRWCITVSARRSARVIVTYQFTKDYLVDHLGIPEENVRVVPIGVDPKELGSLGETATPVTRVEEDLLFLGSWNPWARGGDLVIRAMPKVLSEHPKARLWFAGKSAETETMQRLARRLGVEGAIKFCGFLPEKELGAKLRSVGALVYPSRIGFSLSVMQAMHVGTPVVVNDWLDMPEFVGNSGIVVRRDSVEDLASGILRLLDDPPLSRTLVDRGRRRVREFSVERMIEGTLSVYAEVAGDTE